MVVRKTERQQCGPSRAFVFVVTYVSVAESVATGDQKYFLCGIEILQPSTRPTAAKCRCRLSKFFFFLFPSFQRGSTSSLYFPTSIFWGAGGIFQIMIMRFSWSRANK